MMKLFLLVAGVFLIPVALSYGVVPAATLPKFMNITVEGTDQTHVFRALMGLYLGMVTFCIIAAFTPEWQHVAVIWAVFFAYSLAEWKPAKLPWVSDKTVATLVTLGFLEEKQDESHARFVRLTDKGRRLVEAGRY